VRNKHRAFQFEVLREPEVGAVALPGGFIFVTTALLDLCTRTPDELAFVLGHEMGHVVRGHAIERALTRIGAEGLSTILSRGLLNPTLREIGLEWLQRSHAVDAEMEADEFAVRIIQAAQFNAVAGLNWLNRISKLRSSSSVPGEYLKSHPPETERMVNARRFLSG
jgi:predicted Zn-dependent protease